MTTDGYSDSPPLPLPLHLTVQDPPHPTLCRLKMNGSTNTLFSYHDSVSLSFASDPYMKLCRLLLKRVSINQSIHRQGTPGSWVGLKIKHYVNISGYCSGFLSSGVTWLTVSNFSTVTHLQYRYS